MARIRIIIEGAQGSGKTAIANVVHEALRKHGIESSGTVDEKDTHWLSKDLTGWSPIEVVTTHQEIYLDKNLN